MEGEELEICNDNGFIFKRRKRKPGTNPPPGSSFKSDETHPRNRLLRRKSALLAVRDRYRREIEKLDELSASLMDSGRSGADRIESCPETQIPWVEKDGEGASERRNVFGSSIEELFSLAEGQEAVILKLLDLCDVADSMCDVREKAVVESLLDLPVWESPKSLMDSLVD